MGGRCRRSAVSGVYLAKLERTDGVAGTSHIAFVVRDDGGGSDLLFQTSDTTWQAYNDYGGNSLYEGAPDQDRPRAYKVSYNRPFDTREETAQDWLFHAEYPMIRWLERNGYDVSYSSGVDTDARGAELREHATFLSVGHDEYWSAGQRANVEAARDAGVNLAFFSGNEVFWKTRWEAGSDGASHRTLVSYKETHATSSIDPSSQWTGTWRDPRPFNPEGARPENALTGTAFMVNSGTRTIRVPAADGRLRLWRNTPLATLPAGQVATLADDTLGYEWDSDLDNGVRPPGLVRLSTSQEMSVLVLQDFGSEYDFDPATHHLTLHRRGNALVFGAGTIQWSWGLDSQHDNSSGPASAPMQQATANLLADMDAQPATPADVQPASASTDVTPPTSTVTAPAAGTVVNANAQVTATGSASDTGGGRVGGVEVSVDGGQTWHPAEGRETWSYTWFPDQTGPVTVLSRAADDSANLQGTTRPPAGGGGTPGGGGGTPPAAPAAEAPRAGRPADRRRPPRVRRAPAAEALPAERALRGCASGPAGSGCRAAAPSAWRSAARPAPGAAA